MSTDVQKLLRPAALGLRWGMSPSTIRRMANEGRLPAPVRLSERIFGWPIAVIEGIERDKGVTGTKPAAAAKKGSK